MDITDYEDIKYRYIRELLAFPDIEEYLFELGDPLLDFWTREVSTTSQTFVTVGNSHFWARLPRVLTD
jgi:hypothetical protein